MGIPVELLSKILAEGFVKLRSTALITLRNKCRNKVSLFESDNKELIDFIFASEFLKEARDARFNKIKSQHK